MAYIPPKPARNPNLPSPRLEIPPKSSDSPRGPRLPSLQIATGVPYQSPQPSSRPPRPSLKLPGASSASFSSLSYTPRVKDDPFATTTPESYSVQQLQQQQQRNGQAGDRTGFDSNLSELISRLAVDPSLTEDDDHPASSRKADRSRASASGLSTASSSSSSASSSSSSLVLRPDDFDDLGKLGEGASGEVRKVRHRPTGILMAKKV
jgi:mitogen-activated protein kinase kinase